MKVLKQSKNPYPLPVSHSSSTAFPSGYGLSHLALNTSPSGYGLSHLALNTSLRLCHNIDFNSSSLQASGLHCKVVNFLSSLEDHFHFLIDEDTIVWFGNVSEGFGKSWKVTEHYFPFEIIIDRTEGILTKRTR